MSEEGTSVGRRELGTSGLSSSRLVLGTMTFGSQVDQRSAEEMVRVALDAGVDHFDTANVYNHGAAEEMLGRALAGRRDEVIIATKVRNRMDDAPDGSGLGAPAVRRAIDDSLRRLGTDRVDLYYLHQPDWAVPIEETLGAMAELVVAGKVRHVGLSNYAAWQMAAIAERGPQAGWPPARIAQQLYNPLSRGLEEEYAGFAGAYGIATLVYNPLAGGLLTGKHRRRGEPSSGRFAESENYRNRYWNEPQMDAVDRLEQVAAAEGVSLLALTLRWLLAQPLVDGVILGASSPDQLRANLAAADGPAPSDKASTAMDEVWSQLRGTFPRYNR